MKRLINILTLLICLFSVIPAQAVTDKEMDQARAIAAKAYLRYANDGSGYLDNISPKSMADLEKSLKPKEKENIKAFRDIPVPKDYASWDKQKLVEYWGVTAFSAKGLLDKGRIGKGRAKKNLLSMKVSAPAKEDKAAPAKPEATTQAASPSSDRNPVATTSAAPSADSQQTEINTNDTLATSTDPLSDPLFADLDSEPQLTKAKDHTWVYIIILCILVAVVVALVVFASNVMKKNGERISQPVYSPATGDSPTGDVDAIRKKYEAVLSAKNNELNALSKKFESLNTQNTSLKSNLEGLTAEIASLRNRLAEANKKIAGYESSSSAPENAASQANIPVTPSPAPAPQAFRQAPQQAPTPQQTDSSQAAPAVRSIFLGRANSKGIFVRADRVLNPGNSIFRLDTTDGYAGSFRVVSNPTVWEMARLAPAEYLAGACVAPDFTNTDSMTKVVNDSAGTAIFEGGCWKVIRKAKIHFE